MLILDIRFALCGMTGAGSPMSADCDDSQFVGTVLH